MKFSSRWSVAALVVLASLVAVTAASAGQAVHRASIQACVLLPDTKSSARYELFDRPYVLKAFKAAGVAATVVNAQGDAQ